VKLVKFLCIILITFLLPSCDRPRTIDKNWVHISSTKGDIPSPGPPTQQTACLILDVDRNAKNDFIIASREKGPSVLWYQRTKTGWTKHVIDNALLPIEAGGAYYDIDSDGDADIVFGGDYQSNKVWWWENPYPDFHPSRAWKRRLIKNDGFNMHHDQVFGDFDGDGATELVTWNQGTKKGGTNTLFIADIPPDPANTQPWQYMEIFSSPYKCEGLARIDINGDGKQDIVGGGGWFKHDGGDRYSRHIIDGQQSSARVAAGQLKEGGWPEVVFVIGDGVGRLKWYEYNGNTWVGTDLLGFDVDHGHSLEIDDFNADGKLDIFCGEMRLHGKNKEAKIWIFLGDGKGNFTKKQIAEGFGIHEAKLGDLDGDGDIDILGKPYDWDTPRIDIWLNNISRSDKLSLDQWQRHIIDSKKPWRSVFIDSADLNSDGHNDIITGGWWYKNPGKPSGTWQRKLFGIPLNNMAFVRDFDGDGDRDILGTEGKGSEANSNFVWAQNNGDGSFRILNNISRGDGDFLQGAALARPQDQTPLNIFLSWHASGKGIQMLTIPSDPSSQNWPLQLISNISQDECLSVGDIDGDGDVDLLLGTKWLSNHGSSWEIYEISGHDDRPDRNRLVDMNGDGKLDAVVGFEAISKKGKLAWYEQGRSATATWQEHVIDNITGPMSLDVADMDHDGDADVIVGEHNMKNPSKAKLYIYENIDGRGVHWQSHVVHTGDEHHDGARVVDIDSDGDLDIISIGWSHPDVILYENKAIENP